MGVRRILSHRDLEDNYELCPGDFGNSEPIEIVNFLGQKGVRAKY